MAGLQSAPRERHNHAADQEWILDPRACQARPVAATFRDCLMRCVHSSFADLRRSRREATGVWVVAFSLIGREALAQGGGGGVYVDAGLFAILAAAALFAVCKSSRRG